MSIAKKCDVCGKLYESYTMECCECSVNGIMLLDIDNNQKCYALKQIDCCRDCMTKIKKIIEGESANECQEENDEN